MVLADGGPTQPAVGVAGGSVPLNATLPLEIHILVGGGQKSRQLANGRSIAGAINNLKSAERGI